MADFSGDWNSYYRYPSTARGEDFWGQHLLRATQAGKRLTLETVPESSSQIMIELELNGDGTTAKGVWAEDTSPDGFYGGRRYEGTIELKIAEDGGRMNGIWHGAGRDGTMHSDIWELVRAKAPLQTDGLPKRWKLTHWYPGDKEGEDASDTHEMKGYWSGAMLVLESLPTTNGSYILARLHVQDNVATGNWYENASLTGKYKGAQYSGAGQLVVDPETYRMEGLWAGAGLDHQTGKVKIYTNRWEVMPIDET